MKYSFISYIGALLFAPPTLGMCNVPQPRLVCAEYFASTVVVEATVTKVGAIHVKEDPDGIAAFKYSLRVNHVVRGQIDPDFQIYEGNDSGRATFDWKAGREYLLFLFYSASDKAWELDGCGNSGPTSSAKGVLQEIAAIKASHGGGVIHGVISQQALSVPVSAVRVEARGAHGHYSATTNSHGEFEIKVPAGRYAVRAIKTGFSFANADISYENPNKVKIESGGCAQVQLVSVGETSH